MRIGLLGFGVVGKGVYDLTRGRSDIQIAKVLCLEDITLPDAEVTKDFQSILTDESIDTVVEAMGGLHPSFEFVSAAIRAGKNIITSNKALVATYYDTLLPLVRENGVRLRCTAAVGGGIGWLGELERSRRAQTLSQVGGIMNGTCNYILHAMATGGLSYADALAQAQKLGYAEAKPATDVEGIDTWHKLILSANIAFGVSMEMDSIPAAGIHRISADDIEAFRQDNKVCKLIGQARRSETGVSAWVMPVLFDNREIEASVPANYNLITLVGNASGRMSFYGQGAGRYPTAYNVVQDCVDLISGKGFYSTYGEKVCADNTELLPFYVRGCRDSWLDSVTQTSWGQGVRTVPVSIKKMHAWRKAHPDAFIAAIPEN